MSFESTVLKVVKSVTKNKAYFFNGTLFVETEDPFVALDVFTALDNQGINIANMGKAGPEAVYDFA